MVESDLAEIMVIELGAYSHPWSEKVFRDCFQPHDRPWVLMDGDRLAGYAVVSNQYDEAHLLNLCVRRELQGRGAGRMLLRYLIAEAARDGMAAVLLEVRKSNEPALGLYLAEGFEDIGVRPNYYPAAEGREDARVLRLPLTTS
ncbi:ribosomal protein S18-alanine N-acetyltransferase [Marinobacter xestospongiae]|uniref:ribosomal protein S18-alanine N-acetyltransferase n=1 Tax=Marinobacter xestospongiae TaxID=994319 RepID=UPI0020046B80|nr:ribosomal protein S18-alanine N-acetyltransferase [Marinobacter xestospongiae]MCK7567640.1 ribosomal protein S18-alanine N-acetyltransferase [Marinobacter xestospongiae]